jgi:hypothetical protein
MEDNEFEPSINEPHEVPVVDGEQLEALPEYEEEEKKKCCYLLLLPKPQNLVII